MQINITKFNPYSAGIDLSRQNLTSVKRQILTSNIYPRAYSAR